MKTKKRKWVSLAAAAMLLAGAAGVSPTALAAYGDIDGHWAEDTIVKWEDEGYITGYTDGTFRPDQPISRLEFVTLANRAFGFTASAEISFQDVAPSDWGYEEIQKAVAAGYIQGDEAHRFRPGDTVTRQEAAVMLAKINHLPVSSDLSGAQGQTDDDSIADWARPYVEAVMEAGVMSGLPDGSFGAQAPATRAEGVAALDKAVSAYQDNEAVDHTLTQTALSDAVVEGDLILPASLGGETIVLTNVTVNGTVKVQGGGTVQARTCDFNAVELDKSGVVFAADADASIGRLEFLQNGAIQGQGYGSVIIAEDGVTEAIIAAAVETVQLSTHATVKLDQNAAVSTLEITEEADGGKTTVSKGSSVDHMEIRGKVRITGQGDVSSMTVYVSGVTSSVKPDRVELKEDGKTPSYTGESASGGGGGSSGGSRPSFVAVTDLSGVPSSGVTGRPLTLQAAVVPGNASYQTIQWSVDASENTCGAYLSEDNVLNAVSGGSVTVTATIDNGAAGGKAFVKRFTITFAADAPQPPDGTGPVLDSISASAASVKAGEAVTLTANITGDAAGYSIHWTVSDPAVAELSASTGNPVSLTGNAAGSVTVTAELQNSGGETVDRATAGITVTKEEPPAVPPVLDSISASATSVKVGEAVTLTADVTGDAAGYSIHWSVSAAAAAAELSASTGNPVSLTGSSAGSVTVTAELQNSAGAVIGRKAISIAVEPTQVTAITLQPEKASYEMNETVTATAELSGALAKEAVVWSSSDADYVEVTPDPDGGAAAVLTIKKADTTEKTVTVSASVDGQASAATREIVIAPFIPVQRIDGVPSSAALNTHLPLTGTIEPSDATNQTVTWTIKDDGGTNASITDDNLTGTTAGTVTVTAVVANGTLAGDYTQDFEIQLGPRIAKLSAAKTTAAAGEVIRVTVDIDYPETGYRINWTAPSSNIEPTYDAMYQTTSRYGADATITFPNKDESFTVWAHVQDDQGRRIDSERISISGIATIDYISKDYYTTMPNVAPGSSSVLRIVADWSGTFRWSLETPTEGVALSAEEGESVVLTVAENVADGTEIIIHVSVEGNDKGGKTVTYTVRTGS